MEYIVGKRFGEERALYALSGARVENCSFSGEEDGESALKESHDIEVIQTNFHLRYPFWHTKRAVLENITMSESCRAPLWYAEDINLRGGSITGPKAVRECRNMHIESTHIESAEFGWMCREISVEQSYVKGEYAFFHSQNLTMHHLHLEGKYSFQYVENMVIVDSNLDTKDAFWHSKNVTVRNSIIKGEYLGWYCENVTFENCVISGTQPLCYCKGLKLINCRMDGADLAFEKSEVDATVTSEMISIKNPTSGRICVPRVQELIINDENSKCVLEIGDDNNERKTN